MSSYLVQEEDGTSRFTLEDSSGFILLETSTSTPSPSPSPSTGGKARLYEPPPLIAEDDEALAYALLL